MEEANKTLCYSNQPAETALPSQKWLENPYFHQGESPTYTFDITTNLAAGLPIQNIACTSHKVDIRKAETSGYLKKVMHLTGIFVNCIRVCPFNKTPGTIHDAIRGVIRKTDLFNPFLFGWIFFSDMIK